jgi:hypothetical protein
MLILENLMQVVLPDDDSKPQIPPQVVDVSPVLEWLRSLGLERYEDIFVREEIDFDALQWLTEEVCFTLNCFSADQLLSIHLGGTLSIIKSF